jgi:DNA-binding transcriptional ArsR family regulator
VKSEFNQNLIAIGRSAGEVAGLLDIPYLRQAHQRRQRIREAAASASLDGRETDPQRLYAWLADIPIAAYSNLGGEGYAAEIFQSLANPAETDLGREAKRLAATAESEAGGDLVELGALLFRGRDRIHAASRLAFALALRRSLGPAEPAISASLFGLQAAAQRPRGHFDAFMARALGKAAHQALTAAFSLRRSIVSARSALKDDRQTSRIHAIGDLLFAGHPLSQAEAARIFKLSRLAARTHLLRLVKLGLVEPATRRKSGQIYVARDEIMTFAAPPTPRPPAAPTARALDVSRGKPLSQEERERINAATDEVAARMEDLDRMLHRLKNSATPD